MGRHKKRDLEEFSSYLADQGLSAPTIKNYCSHVRHLRGKFPEPTEEALMLYIHYDVPVLSRTTMRTAWNAYRDSVIAAGGPVPPEAKTLKAGSAARPGPQDTTGALSAPQEGLLPSTLARALQSLVRASRVPVVVLREARWRDITVSTIRGSAQAILRHNDSENTTSRFDLDTLQALVDWAAPQDAKPKVTQPLIPETAGSTTPMRAADLRRALNLDVKEAPAAIEAAVFDFHAQVERAKTAAPLQLTEQEMQSIADVPAFQDLTVPWPPPGNTRKYACTEVEEKDLPPLRIGGPLRPAPSNEELINGLK